MNSLCSLIFLVGYKVMAENFWNCSHGLRITHRKNKGADCFLFDEESTPTSEKVDDLTILGERLVHAAMEYGLRSSLMAHQAGAYLLFP